MYNHFTTEKKKAFKKKTTSAPYKHAYKTHFLTQLLYFFTYARYLEHWTTIDSS